MNHFHGEKLLVSIHSTPYDSKPEVMGLALPIDHITGIITACSLYVKNMDMESRNAGTMDASATPRKNLTTNKVAKLLHGICRRVIPPLLSQ